MQLVHIDLLATRNVLLPRPAASREISPEFIPICPNFSPSKISLSETLAVLAIRADMSTHRKYKYTLIQFNKYFSMFCRFIRIIFYLVFVIQIPFFNRFLVRREPEL